MQSTGATPPLSQKRILLTWLPLAASWLLMALEMPYVNAALARLPDSVLMIAAFGLAASLSITIESPVISLLATSTALARSPQNYAMLRRFTVQLMVGTTLLQALLAWSPLFELVVRDWMGVPTSLLAPVKLGLQLMLLWSAAIAWRRFRQGILIRFGQSASVGKGTVVRLLASAGTATLLAVFTDASGVALGTLALSLGVIAEAIYAHIASAGLVRTHFGAESTLQAPDLSYRALVNFHWPLATSNLLFLLTQPLIAAALARSPEPETALAAWPVLNGLFFISRSLEMALPEVVIAHYDEPGSQPALRRFSYSVGLAACALLALVAYTPLSDFYFHTLIGVSDELAVIAEGGARLGVLLPLAMAAVCLARGLLTARRNTRPQAYAMALELGVLAGVLALGVALRLPSIPTAVAALTLSLGTEAIYLGSLAQKPHIHAAAVPAQN
ncbi:MAG: hypothetical protein KIT70_10625 [Anaerolineales bacterium]|nr:MAG: hypothetical protein KIT70_10625 [Anaerolineales bacterium]